ncbi:Fic family protein [Leadbettera azotonutricia]|uniref:Filamentation induced by cAMP protein Fic n=1 Tax=Leadbettera azotonutricia (strain ATCC BAA-888 / DSM 13862 / ZAS-9) TaxID=545695 RepID=F5YEH8_LEAAZ|nr:Fic family protein [Leadbettera azotonutricia]AEF80236.1 filamentation induced by cAMP protein Fic [Leadbettera azotonutricia ZAS-9]
MDNYNIPVLPLAIDVESKVVLRKIAFARSALAEMKGSALSIPNESILIRTLSLQEAKSSSEVENIITTQDDIFQSDFYSQTFKTVAAKEVYNYAHALTSGFDILKKRGFLSINQILDIQAILVETKAGFRKLPGTELKNEQTGTTVYTPPQDYDTIVSLMSNLEKFINDPSISDLDPLIKMAIIHHQFESIHPFYDGNGRTGRIINVLYLVKEGLLDFPILYLSRYINQNKSLYYSLLQKVRTDNAWEEWVLFILDGIEKTALQTTQIIKQIKNLMLSQKRKLRGELKRIYSQDLLNNIFRHPYTKIKFVENDLKVTRVTAAKYLEELVRIGILEKQKLWKDNFYINRDLYKLLSNVHDVQL